MTPVYDYRYTILGSALSQYFNHFILNQGYNYCKARRPSVSNVSRSLSFSWSEVFAYGAHFVHDRLLYWTYLYPMIYLILIICMVISLLHWKRFMAIFNWFTSHFIPCLHAKWPSEIQLIHIIYGIIVRKFCIPHFISFIWNSSVIYYTSNVILHALESCYRYVITFWWYVGTRSWLTSFVLVLLR